MGGLVVVPHNQHGLLKSAAFMKRVIEHQLVEPSLSYGQRPPAGGFHIMQVFRYVQWYLMHTKQHSLKGGRS